jgi:RND superfamily putative drug exporter
VIAAVIALGFLVLMMAFRSVLVPAQAAIGNVLSVVAAFGVVTAVFQLGWGTSLLGLDGLSGGDVPIASFVPLIMFAVLFGLSMDYQVFLMSQIEHARARTKDDREAIALGLATGARVIAAAALIMISVFGSFILNGDPTVKQFGVGLAVGVALAAITVLTFAPALLVLAGKGAWWVPDWADRFLPKIDIEGSGSQPGAAPANPAKPYKAGSLKL